MERRKSPRYPLGGHTLWISNHENGVVMGELVDISDEGFMLLSDQSPSVGGVCQLELNSELQPLVPLRFGARVLWQSDSESAGTIWTGWHIIDMAEDVEQVLHALIQTTLGD